MAAGNYDIKLEQNVTRSIELTFYTDSTKVATIDLSSYTFDMRVRKEKDDPDYIDDLTSANGRIDTTNAATGVILLKWSAAQSAAYNFDEAYYDLKSTNAGVITREMEGLIILSKRVTE